MDTRITTAPPPADPAPVPWPPGPWWLFWLGVGFWLASIGAWVAVTAAEPPSFLGMLFAAMALAGSILEGLAVLLALSRRG